MKFLLFAFLALLGLWGFLPDELNGYRSRSQLAQELEIQQPISDFEKAVEIIKKYETLHQPKHWPLVGYGHMVRPGEKFSRSKAMAPDKAEELLRKDLLKNCAVFRSYGADSLLLGVLAYNIGSGAVKKSSVVRKLNEGNRDIRDTYISYSKYRGKPHTQLRNRRIEEFEALFIENPDNQTPTDTITITEIAKNIENHG